jgi:hypothetical protein
MSRSSGKLSRFQIVTAKGCLIFWEKVKRFPAYPVGQFDQRIHRLKTGVSRARDSRIFPSIDLLEVSVIRTNKARSLAAGLLLLGAGFCSAQTPAPSFTISATNVTMPSSGMVAIPFTLTSVNGFVGSVSVFCFLPTVAGSVNKGPYCEDYGPAHAFPLTANGTTTGNYSVVAILPDVLPAAKSANQRVRDGRWALAGVLMLGIGLRRKRRFARGWMAVGVLGLIGMGLSGCGGPPTLTPGPYAFTLSAQSVDTTPTITASTTAIVTVPAGIVTKSSN